VSSAEELASAICSRLGAAQPSTVLPVRVHLGEALLPAASESFVRFRAAYAQRVERSARTREADACEHESEAVTGAPEAPSALARTGLVGDACWVLNAPCGCLHEHARAIGPAPGGRKDTRDEHARAIGPAPGGEHACSAPASEHACNDEERPQRVAREEAHQRMAMCEAHQRMARKTTRGWHARASEHACGAPTSEHACECSEGDAGKGNGCTTERGGARARECTEVPLRMTRGSVTRGSIKQFSGGVASEPETEYSVHEDLDRHYQRISLQATCRV
jgi:hypothetical protein